jgi:hypothetical protein
MVIAALALRVWSLAKNLLGTNAWVRITGCHPLCNLNLDSSATEGHLEVEA